LTRPMVDAASQAHVVSPTKAAASGQGTLEMPAPASSLMVLGKLAQHALAQTRQGPAVSRTLLAASAIRPRAILALVMWRPHELVQPAVMPDVFRIIND